MLETATRTKAAFILVALVLGLSIVVLLSIVKKSNDGLDSGPPPIEDVAPAAQELPWQTMTVIGSSVEGRSIEAHTYGTGNTHLLFVGGMHGGYEWNSVLLAYELMDYLAFDPTRVPLPLTIHIIPSLNPDGVFTAIEKEHRFTLTDVPSPNVRMSSARFNASGVDLNRNFDCKWQPKSSWRGAEVSAGKTVFSEPEAVALRDYVLKIKPQAAILWHSQAGNVYASECEAGILPFTRTLMNTYASAAGYGAVESFDAYPITGDAEGWLAKIGIPAVTVELTSFNSSEFTKNVAGTLAVFKLFSTNQ